MKKAIFAVLVLLLLIGGTYLFKGGGEKSGNDNTNPSDYATGVIQVTGLVENPFNLTLIDLMKMPSRKVEAPLYCVDNPKTPRVNGTWEGVPLRIILERAGVKGFKVAFFASDGYTTDLLVEDVMNDEDIIVAYRFKNESISPRLVVPNRWGYKWIKDITKIEVVNYDFRGTWENAGYPDDAYIPSIDMENLGVR